MLRGTFFNSGVLAGPLTVASDKEGLYRSATSASGNTDNVTVTPSGGTAPYTYAWTLEGVGGDGQLSVNSPTSATTSFAYSLLKFLFTEVYANARCTVTDVYGNTGYKIISVNVVRENNE